MDCIKSTETANENIGREGGSQHQQAGKFEQELREAVYEFFGRQFTATIRVLSDEQMDCLTGNKNCAAITDREGNIYIRKGYESDGLHELVHAAGFQEDSVSTFINEGFTQLTAEIISSEKGIAIRQTYQDETKTAELILRAIGEDRRALLQGYALAKDKSRYLTEALWKKYAHLFADAEDWGRDPYKSMYRDLQSTYGYSPYLQEIFDHMEN